MIARIRMKHVVLRALELVGAFSLCARTPWRDHRLMILGFHGTSRLDEHRWEPTLYHSPASLESRLQEIARGGYHVLPLAEGIERLYNGTLPPRSLVLTFDDGFAEFGDVVQPLLRRYGLPATVYLTTFYSEADLPVFNPFGRYLLWKRTQDEVDASCLLGRPERWNLATFEGQTAAFRSLYFWAKERRMCAVQKDALLDELAALLGVDPKPFRARRMFHILRPDEVTALSREGIDFQLHTHRHRTPTDREEFLQEIEQNRVVLERLRPGPAVHLAYPSGVHAPEFLPWLREAGVRTATTVEPGLATRESDPLLLPRVIDVDHIPMVEFRAWLCGIRSLFPTAPRHARLRQTAESPAAQGHSLPRAATPEGSTISS